MKTLLGALLFVCSCTTPTPTVKSLVVTAPDVDSGTELAVKKAEPPVKKPAAAPAKPKK